MIERKLAVGLFALILQAPSLEAAELPSEAGQSAFAALAEIAATLEADTATDWSRVSLLALREHLVDMDAVTLRASVEEQPIEGGIRIRVSGDGRTLAAIQRMVPMHTQMVQGHDGWRVDARERVDGFDIDLTTEDPDGVSRLRGLGFFGFLAAGDHHRRHHLGLATGAMSNHHRAGH